MTERFYKLAVRLAAIRQRCLPGTAKIILAIITDRIGKNEKCWAGVRTLARDSGLSVQSVLDCTGVLETAGLLRVVRRGEGKANHYSLPTADQQDKALKKLERPVSPKRSTCLSTGALASRAEALKQVERNQTDPLNQRGAAAPPAPSAFKLGLVPEQNNRDGHAAHRLMMAWGGAFRERVGRGLTPGARGKVAGILGALVPDFGEATLTSAVGEWFAEERKDYGPELFKLRIEGGGLTGKPGGSNRGAAQYAEDPRAVAGGQTLAAELAAKNGRAIP